MTKGTMITKEITIAGKQYPVQFDMQAIMNFEAIAGESFFTANLTTLKSRLALVVAAVLSADSNADITIEDLRGKGDLEAVMALNTAYAVVADLMQEFFVVPEVEKQNAPEPKPSEESNEKPKN